MPDSTTTTSDPWVKIKFTPDPGFELLFDTLNATEELGKPFLYTLDLTSKEPQDSKPLIGAAVSITMKQSADDANPKHLHGIVTRVLSRGLVSGACRYQLEVRPWVWLLSRIVDCRIFQNKSAFDIITTIFRDAGFSDFSDKRQASSGDIVLDYCVQYNETSLDFVTRLMERFGLYYFFTHEAAKHTLMLADDSNSHEALETAIPFRSDQTAARSMEDHIWVWSAARSLESARYTLQDYNFTTPSTDLMAKKIDTQQHPHGNLEVYEYPGPYEVLANGTKLTDVRMQAIGMQRAVVEEAASNARGLRPGFRFTLSNHENAVHNGEYLITSASFSLKFGEGSSGTTGLTTDTYRVKFSAIPASVPYRLARATPLPKIRGPQTALVDGESGEEITTDQYGRVKVKFYWDRAEVGDNQHTCWIRVAQASAGTAWGSMFIPRKGQEVVVEFMEGDPDRPLITGVVYNATVTVPYSLPDNKTISTVKTNSTKGGGGFNEIKLDDKKGEEKVYFQAQKDYEKKVLNDEKITIHKDTVTTVETGDRTVTVQKGNETLNVDTGDRKVTVSKGGDTLTVSAGDHTITISAGKSSITAAQSITLTVGSNSIKIDTGGITLNGLKIDVEASTALSLKGATVAVQGSGSVSVSAPSIALN